MLVNREESITNLKRGSLYFLFFISSSNIKDNMGYMQSLNINSALWLKQNSFNVYSQPFKKHFSEKKIILRKKISRNILPSGHQ